MLKHSGHNRITGATMEKEEVSFSKEAEGVEGMVMAAISRKKDIKSPTPERGFIFIQYLNPSSKNTNAFI